MKRSIIFCILIILAASLDVILFAADAVSLQNPSFEEVSGDLPIGWEKVVYDDKAGASFILSVPGDAHSGERSVAIINTMNNDTRLKQEVSLQKYSVYKLSCWAKVENVARGGRGANISILQQGYSSLDLTGTTDSWQELILYLITGADNIKVTITIGLGGYGLVNRGEAYFDDVKLEPVTSAPLVGPRVDFRQNTGRGKIIGQNSGAETVSKPAIQPVRVLDNRGAIKWQKLDPFLILLAISEGVILLLGGCFYWLLVFLSRRKKIQESDLPGTGIES